MSFQQSYKAHIIILPPTSLPSERVNNFLEYTVLLSRLGRLGVKWLGAQGFGLPSHCRREVVQGSSKVWMGPDGLVEMESCVWWITCTR